MPVPFRIRSLSPTQRAHVSVCEGNLAMPQGAIPEGIDPTRIALTPGTDLPVVISCKPVGGTWPDGSARYLNVVAQVWPDARARTQEGLLCQLEVRPDPVDLPDLELSDWLTQVPLFAARVLVNGSSPMHAGTWLVGPDNPLRRRLVHRGRATDGWWYELTYDLLSGCDYIPFTWQVGWSDPGEPAVNTQVASVEIELPAGLYPCVRDARDKGISLTPSLDLTRWMVKIAGAGTVADGQAIAVRGSLLIIPPQSTGLGDLLATTDESVIRATVAERFDSKRPDVEIEGARDLDANLNRLLTLVAESEAEMVLCDVDASVTGTVSPLGSVPGLPPWLTQGSATDALERDAVAELKSVRFGAFQAPQLGLAAVPAGTGSQNDFGWLKDGGGNFLGQAVRRAAILRSLSFEYGRPTHVREEDGSKVRAAAHPDWHTWTGRTHFNIGASPDRLGKAPGTILPAGGLYGLEVEHWSNNYVYEAWRSANHLAIEEIDHRVEIFLAEFLDTNTGHALEAQYPSRGAARTLYSGCQLWLASGRDDIRSRVMGRARKLQITNGPDHFVGRIRAPLPNNATLLPTRECWLPYEEAFLAVALRGVWRLFGDARALDFSRKLAKTVALYGYQLNPLRIASAVAWNGGAEIDQTSYQDPTWWKPAVGTDYHWWALGAVLLAHEDAVMTGDQSLANRCVDIENAVKATRRKPSSGGFDDKGEWMPVAASGAVV